jgi:hypothetical protein
MEMPGGVSAENLGIAAPKGLAFGADRPLTEGYYPLGEAALKVAAIAKGCVKVPLTTPQYPDSTVPSDRG